ncbi:hypothetical protein MBLNU230_g3739t1 [Neophaeotheca triangularis]
MESKQRSSDNIFNPHLSQNQQDLLDRAISSQTHQDYPQPGAIGIKRSQSDSERQPGTMSGKALYVSPQQDVDLDNYDYTPDLDYLDGDNSFDFDNADLGGDLIGALPGGNGAEQHEKRKSPDEAGSPEEGDAKRQETLDGDKAQSKRPGRKPLTSEPTTKRKAQNRAAQRAFRERKEKHLKDLETKVDELTKAKEADQQENGLLKAQVERLQVELREFRQRTSLNGNASIRSPPLGSSKAQNQRNVGGDNGNNFQFDFPRFGALPGNQNSGQNHSNSSTSSAGSGQSPGTNANGYGVGQSQQAARQNSQARSQSPQTTKTTSSGSSASVPQNNFQAYSNGNNMRGFSDTLPQMNNSSSNGDPFGDLFSPSVVNNAGRNGTLGGNYFASPQPINNNQQASNDNGTDTTSGLSRVFQFNSGSNASDSNSPCSSSQSQWNGANNSSCGTSPEPSYNSPGEKEKSMEGLYSKISPQQNQTQQYNNNNNNNNNGLQANSNNFAPMNGNTDMNVPSLDSFDPVLFADYRDNQDDFLGNNDFGSNFFDDALNTGAFDYASPSNLFGILQSPQPAQQHAKPVQNAPSSGATPSRNLMAGIEKTREGGDDDYGLPDAQVSKKEEAGKLISCNNIWNQLQSNQDFQEGKFDLDGLCSELRQKARCSESGVMVDQNHVDAALRRLSKNKSKNAAASAPDLMFEQESWDRVLANMNGGQGNKYA